MGVLVCACVGGEETEGGEELAKRWQPASRVQGVDEALRCAEHACHGCVCG